MDPVKFAFWRVRKARAITHLAYRCASFQPSGGKCAFFGTKQNKSFIIINLYQ